MAISQINSNSLASGVPASSNMPTGSVLQVVQATYSTPQTATSTTPFSRVNLTITPKFSTSKILLTYSQGDISVNAQNAGISSAFYRNGSSIFKFSSETGRQYNGNYFIWFCSASSYLDSPATTSAITYAVYVWNNSGVGTITYGDSNMPAVLTATEIAG